MLIENFIIEIKELLEEQPLSKIVKTWNKIFPEEKISLESAKEYSEDIIEELRSMIIDELESTDISKLVIIYNRLSNREITEEEIVEEFDSIDDEDFEG